MDFADLAASVAYATDGRPHGPVPVGWPTVEAWLGLPLPADYKQLADTWGPVQFGGRITMPTPCAQSSNGRGEDGHGEDGHGEDGFDYGDWAAVPDGGRPAASR